MRQLKIPELRLNPVEFSQWERIVRRYLANVRNWEVSYLENILKPDRSGSTATLARLSTVRQLLPCPVVCYVLEHLYVLCFRLGKGANYSFTTIPTTHDTAAQFDGAGKTWHGSFNPRNCEVWLVVEKEQTFDSYPYPVASMLKDAIDHLSRIQQSRLDLLLTDSIRKLGFHDSNVHRATGQADRRIYGVTRIRDGEMYKLTPDKLVEDMDHCRLIAACPEVVINVMQRARMLYVHGYEEWEFFTIAEHYASIAVETSVRALYDHWLGNSPIRAKLADGSETEELSPFRETIYQWAKQQKVKGFKVKGLPFPVTKGDLLEHAVRIGALSRWEQERCHYLLYMRDILSHPSGTIIEWIGTVTSVLWEAGRLINVMWARFSGHGFYECTFDGGKHTLYINRYDSDSTQPRET